MIELMSYDNISRFCTVICTSRVFFWQRTRNATNVNRILSMRMGEAGAGFLCLLESLCQWQYWEIETFLISVVLHTLHTLWPSYFTYYIPPPAVEWAYDRNRTRKWYGSRWYLTFCIPYWHPKWCEYLCNPSFYIRRPKRQTMLLIRV